jgi:hypothetical protein
VVSDGRCVERFVILGAVAATYAVNGPGVEEVGLARGEVAAVVVVAVMPVA